GPLLLGVHGVGMIAAGIFRATRRTVPGRPGRGEPTRARARRRRTVFVAAARVTRSRAGSPSAATVGGRGAPRTAVWGYWRPGRHRVRGALGRLAVSGVRHYREQASC